MTRSAKRWTGSDARRSFLFAKANELLSWHCGYRDSKDPINAVELEAYESEALQVEWGQVKAEARMLDWEARAASTE
jgi:hypothetical protein